MTICATLAITMVIAIVFEVLYFEDWALRIKLRSGYYIIVCNYLNVNNKMIYF